MSSANRRKGSLFETDVLKFLRDQALDAERLPKTGKDDEGDLRWLNGGVVYIFELKNEKQMNLTDYIRQAEREAENYRAARSLGYTPHWAVVIKKRNASIKDAFVLTSLSEFIRQNDQVPF